MKTKLLLPLAALALLATGCSRTSASASQKNSEASTSQTTASSSISSGKSTSTNSSTTTTPSASTTPNTSTTPSTTPSVNPEPVEKKLDLSQLQLGFEAKVTLNDDGDYDAYIVGATDNAVKFIDYSSTDERKQGWASTTLKAGDQAQYEPVSKGGKEYFGKAFYDLNGKVNYKTIEISDSVSGGKSEVEWQYMDFDNFFKSLTADDFLLQMMEHIV